MPHRWDKHIAKVTEQLTNEAESSMIAITNGKVMTITQGTLERGTVLV